MTRLIYANHYVRPELSNDKGKWGYIWIGFCNGKRFSIIGDPALKADEIDDENGIYKICKRENIKLLPSELQRMIYGIPLSNKYFMFGTEFLEKSIEVVMSIIENNYDIDKVEMVKYMSFINGDDKFVCRYIETETQNVIVEIQEDAIIWKGRF